MYNYLFLIFLLFTLQPVLAIVKYEEGRLEINGIQLLQDSEFPKSYYYIPPYPRVSKLNSGDFEFMCVKYVGEGEENSGGLFHALIEFTLSEPEKKELEEALKDKVPGAILMGPVPMQTNQEEGAQPSFRLVSTILGEGNAFNRNVISSGTAPLLPGSKAAIAAHLSPEGATLLWDSFQGGTSDVSVVVEGHFRALVKAFKATVKADLEMVYDHFSSFYNNQFGFSRDQAASSLDSLVQSGVIQVDVADMSAGLNVNTRAYQDILQIITERVVDLMFNVDEGWAKLPETEGAVQPTNLKERYERGDFVKFFAGDGHNMYIPDNQLLLKEKKEIRSFKFFLDLNQSTAIKVPVVSAGNIRGFYNLYRDNPKYFRIVDMNDAAFQSRNIYFQVARDFARSFGDIVDYATVLVQKDYQQEGANSFSGTLLFNQSAIDSGKLVQSLRYQRFDDPATDWLNYKYKVGWKFIGIDSMVTVPANNWASTNMPSVAVQPPIDQVRVEIALDKLLLQQNGIQTVRIRFASMLLGKPIKGKSLVIRKNDPDEFYTTTVYHDTDQPIVYQVSWYSNREVIQDDLKLLEDDYLFLVPSTQLE